MYIGSTLQPSRVWKSRSYVNFFRKTGKYMRLDEPTTYLYAHR